MLSARESTGRNPISLQKSPRPAARSDRRNRLSGPFCAGGSPRGEGSLIAMAEPVYRRVVIKLSGEYCAGPQSSGFDQPTIDRVACDLIAARQLGVEIAVVVGGGNLV